MLQSLFMLGIKLLLKSAPLNLLGLRSDAVWRKVSTLLLTSRMFPAQMPMHQTLLAERHTLQGVEYLAHGCAVFIQGCLVHGARRLGLLEDII